MAEWFKASSWNGEAGVLSAGGSNPPLSSRGDGMKSKKKSILSSDGSWKHDPNMATSIVEGFKKLSEHAGRQNQLTKLIRFTDLPANKLASAIDKMSSRDKRDLLKAAADINRVVREIQRSEISENDNGSRKDTRIAVLQRTNNVPTILESTD